MANPELDQLWTNHPGAEHMAVRFDKRQVIIGNNKKTVMEEGIRLYVNDKPIFDYCAQRNLIVTIGPIIVL